MLNIRFKLVVGLMLLVTNCVVGASVLPYGPQNDVPVSTVINDWGWTECYSALYAEPFYGPEGNPLANCSGNYMMLAARRTGSDVFEVLAAARSEDTRPEMEPKVDGITKRANGSEWYHADGFSWGFAGEGDEVFKAICDDKGTDERDRLCWHTLDYVGGWRAGSYTELNESTDWEKVILVANTITVPEPTAALLFALALASLALRRGSHISI
ncbi:hypothetical protein [Corallincola spongiicola]|uniref:PEP-CTERM sorting domain-containing protein n=1 Tax=Corallincola spongiicola TaxID=2520508 RepID=A0ABY1WMW1_9GAMM|nr:hypothetical protein [Corallincola spongiicola]TAA43662.1 hypothetical protein EXY25_13995 [Corallincola spongiicola]